MGGAYTATPDADGQSFPPDWDPNWPFPGPASPGYSYDYSLVLTGPSTMYIGANSAAVTFVVKDHETYETIDIADTVSTSWTAAIEGAALQLKAVGGSEYLDSVSQGYTEDYSGNFWGNGEDLAFDIGEANDGDVITLTATSIVGGQTITETVEITVEVLVVKVDIFQLPGGMVCEDEDGWLLRQRSDMVNYTQPYTYTMSHYLERTLGTYPSGTWTENPGGLADGVFTNFLVVNGRYVDDEVESYLESVYISGTITVTTDGNRKDFTTLSQWTVKVWFNDVLQGTYNMSMSLDTRTSVNGVYSKSENIIKLNCLTGEITDYT